MMRAPVNPKCLKRPGTRPQKERDFFRADRTADHLALHLNIIRIGVKKAGEKAPRPIDQNASLLLVFLLELFLQLLHVVLKRLDPREIDPLLVLGREVVVRAVDYP